MPQYGNSHSPLNISGKGPSVQYGNPAKWPYCQGRRSADQLLHACSNASSLFTAHYKYVGKGHDGKIASLQNGRVAWVGNALISFFCSMPVQQAQIFLAHLQAQ